MITTVKKLIINLISLLGRLWMRFKGAGLGQSVQVIGFPSIKKHSSARIVLADSVSVVSSRWANRLSPGCPSSLVADRPEAILEIRKGAGISNTVVWASKEIIIGEGTMIGSGSMIVDHDFHEIPLGSDNVDEPMPIHIGKMVFIGARSIILKGVTIGDGTVIGAGSVVVKDIPAGVLAGGNPCKVIKKL
jgi:acetyltransferase-like isoleucine patch superfamily enzyme